MAYVHALEVCTTLQNLLQYFQFTAVFTKHEPAITNYFEKEFVESSIELW